MTNSDEKLGAKVLEDDVHGINRVLIANLAGLTASVLQVIDMIDNCADAPKDADSLPQMIRAHLGQSLVNTLHRTTQYLEQSAPDQPAKH